MNLPSVMHFAFMRCLIKTLRIYFSFQTVIMDYVRHRELAQRLHLLVIAGSVLLVTLTRAASPALQQSTSFKEKLLHDVKIVLQDVKDNE